jgi:hypothetical protein
MDSQSSLPLGWTQIRRRTRLNPPTPSINTSKIPDDFASNQKFTSFSPITSGGITERPPPQHDSDVKINNTEDHNAIYSCGCTNSRCRRRRDSGKSSSIATISSTSSSSRQRNEQRRRRIQGTAVFCLPDPDSDWFQGYLFASLPSLAATTTGNNKNNHKRRFGLLCTNQDLDACLECAAGGYREFTLQVTEFDGADATNRNHHDERSNERNYKRSRRVSSSSNSTSSIMNDIECTGGDMMQWTSPYCKFTAATVWTGDEAERRVVSIFAGLVKQLRRYPDIDNRNNNEEEVEDDQGTGCRSKKGRCSTGDATVHDLMPHVAVVGGTMELWLPYKEEEQHDGDDDFLGL